MSRVSPPQGAVVASVQHRAPGSTTPRLSYIWISGRAHRLAGPAAWSFTDVAGVSDDGTNVGTARIRESDGHYVFRAVAWSHDGSHVVFERATGNGDPSPVIDGQGDIAYVDRDASQDVAYPTAAGADTIYATVQQGIMRWREPTGVSEGPLVGQTVGAPDSVFAADDADDLLVGGITPSHLHTVRGAVVTLPSQAQVDVSRKDPGVAIAGDGTVAFTSAKDDLPHLLRCTTHQ